MSDKTKKPEKPVVYGYYGTEDGKRVVRSPSMYAAILHFFLPKVRRLNTDEVIAFKEAGGTTESVTAKPTK